MKLQPTGKFDNSAKPYDHITVTPLASAMGARISGVDLARLTDVQFEEIEDALYRHKMIYFRDQKISHSDHEQFTQRLGKFGTDAYTTGLPNHPEIQPLIKEAETRVKMIFGEGWHTDSPFLPRPPSISTLYSVEVPPYGGDTIWCNTELAYDCLSDTMKAVLAPLRVHMSAAGVLAEIDRLNPETKQGDDHTRIGNMELDVERQSMIAGSYHPIVRTHPVTGKKSLYVEQTYSSGIEGMTDAEARPLLDFLLAHITHASFTCRLRWKANTFVAWDNRSCIHHAFNDYDGYRREMYRTTVLGEVPV
jgi:taurine dioxygenase